MKLLLLLSIAGLCLAQDQSALHITVIMPDGTEHTAKVTGAPAAAGLDVLMQWLAKQRVCVPSTVPDVPTVCTLQYPNLAQAIKALVIDKAEEQAPKFPSSALKADADEIAAKQAALEAKRKAAFAAARAEQ